MAHDTIDNFAGPSDAKVCTMKVWIIHHRNVPSSRRIARYGVPSLEIFGHGVLQQNQITAARRRSWNTAVLQDLFCVSFQGNCGRQNVNSTQTRECNLKLFSAITAGEI